MHRASAPLRDVIVDLPIPRRHKPGDLFGTRRSGNVENTLSRVEPGHGDDIWLGGPGLQPTMCVVRAEAPTGEAEVCIGSVRRGRRPREQADDFWITWILHVDYVRRVVILAAIGFHGLMRGDHDV